MKKKITFIGSGKITNAIISGLIFENYPKNHITVCSPTLKNRTKLKKNYGVNSSHDNIKHSKKADIIIIAVKPEIIPKICKDLKNKIEFNKKIILTTAAGVPIKKYQKLLFPKIKLIRIMPNILSLINQGFTGMYASSTVSNREKIIVEKIIKKIGKILWLKQENDIHKITCITGSGPAYFFLFMEFIQKEAEKLGFKKKLAKQLVTQLAKGSSLLASNKKQYSFYDLKKLVCSKKGTTIKGLKEFYQSNLDKIISKVIQSVFLASKKIEKKFN